MGFSDPETVATILPSRSYRLHGNRRCFGRVARKKPESELVCGALGKLGQRGMSVEADPVWRIAASAATIHGTLPRERPSGQRQSEFVSFAGGKGEHGACAVSRTAGRPAEALREGSGIKSTGHPAMGSQSAPILRIPGMTHREKTSRPDLPA